MNNNIFVPKSSRILADGLVAFFYKAARALTVLLFSFLPILFIPSTVLPVGLVKISAVLIGIIGIITLVSLAILRSGRFLWYTSWPLVIFWLNTIFLVLLSFLTPDTRDALFGQTFTIHTTGFFLFMALAMTAPLLLIGRRSSFIKFLFFSAVSACLLLCSFLVQVLFGQNIGLPDMVSVIGSYNDVALYAGLIILLLILLLSKIQSSWQLRVGASLILTAALLVLAIVNFTFLWTIIAFISLLAFLYLIAKDTWLTKSEDRPAVPMSRFALAVIGVLCVVSGSFVVAGDYLGTKVATMTGVNYLEVRPSFGATVEVTKEVYQENAFFGIGPNRFEDAWRLFKDPVINETSYWNTSFTSGHSFAVTLFTTSGLIGGVVFISFLVGLLSLVYKVLFTVRTTDSGWRYTAIATAVSSLYLWTVTFLYTPGTVMMLLTAFLSGLFITAVASIEKERLQVFDMTVMRQSGVVMIAVVLLVVIGTGVWCLKVSNVLYADYTYRAAEQDFLAGRVDLVGYDAKLKDASLFDESQDVYAAERSRLRLLELNRLIGITEPSPEEQERFGSVLVEGIALAEEAIAKDRTSPSNYALLGSFYGMVNESAYEGVAEKRNSAFSMARQYDPYNPEYAALEAQILARFGNLPQAKDKINEALVLKPNFTDALFLSSQLDVQVGNATSAIATTEAIIRLEPNNPARYFQLGLLQLALKNYSPAIEALKAAIVFDYEYANARYMLALAYLDTNQPELALTELRFVAERNPDNASLASLITQIESGDYTNPDLGYTVPVSENPVRRNDDTNNELISPVNEVVDTTAEVSNP